MKVVIAALSSPTSMNGVSRHGMNLARALLVERGITSVHFIAGKWQKNLFRDIFEIGDSRLHTHWVSLPDANVSRLFWYSRELPQIAEQLQADIVHLTFPVPLSPGAMSCPVVLSLHDLYPFDIPGNFGFFRSAVARYIIGQCVPRVNAIACVSLSTQSLLRTHFGDLVAKSTVVPNIVEFPDVCAPGTLLGRLDGSPFVLCVAQHRANKRVDLAIETFAQLLGESVLSVEAKLLIVGIQGPETKKIHKRIRDLRLGGKVLLMSGLSDAQIRWAYENCQVLLAPSKVEGFGLPIAEGMLSGARIVCSDIPAFREIGDGYCHFVAPDLQSADAYALAARSALTTSRPLGARLAGFSHAAVGRAYARLYENISRSPFPQTLSEARCKSLMKKEIW